MKKFIRKVIVFALCFAVLPVLLCVAADPFGVLHPLNVHFKGVDLNKNYIKMSYILANPGKFDSLMFGSSRSGNIHVENIPDRHCYNMYYTDGLPGDHLFNIRTLINEGVPLRTIYMGVDSISYTNDPALHRTQALRAPYEMAQDDPFGFWKLYFDPAVVLESLKLALDIHKDPTYEQRFYDYGWYADYNYESQCDVAAAPASIGSVYRMEETLADIRAIRDLCRENGIELVVFTNPMYKVTYEASLGWGYDEFLRSLAEITPFYNFSGLNDITEDPASFFDESHYIAEVGDMMIDAMCCGVRHEGLYEQGFGVYVTEENVEDVLLAMHG